MKTIDDDIYPTCPHPYPQLGCPDCGAWLTAHHAETFLRHLRPISPWRETAKEPPTKEDCDIHELVLAQRYDEGCPDTYAWDSVRDFPMQYPYWTPIPPLPDLSGPDNGRGLGDEVASTPDTGSVDVSEQPSMGGERLTTGPSQPQPERKES